MSPHPHHHAAVPAGQRRTPGLPLGMPAARKLSAAELGLLLLQLLQDGPNYGTALGERIASLSGGFYHPSPGVLYPALKTLEGTGQVCVVRQGRRKHYYLTGTGRQGLAARNEEAARIVARLERAGRKLNAIRQAMSADDASDTGDDANDDLAHAVLEARMDLKAALFECRQLDAEGQSEIVRILRDTSVRIRELTHSGVSPTE